MSRELFFFFTKYDPNVVDFLLSSGRILLYNKNYIYNEEPVVFSYGHRGDVPRPGRFYVLDSLADLRAVEMGRYGGQLASKSYIRDRVGSASIDLVFYAGTPDEAVHVGSISFQNRTYDGSDGDLVNVDEKYTKIFLDLKKYIKENTETIGNEVNPKKIHIFPSALAKIKEDLKNSPWSTIILEDC